MTSPLSLAPLFRLGPVPITAPVLVTWGIMAVMCAGAWLLTRRLALVPSRLQAAIETVVEVLDAQLRETLERDPSPYRPLIGTLFLYVLAANWSSLVPGVDPPTAHLETDAALAFVVLGATIGCGTAALGLRGYLATFARPSWVMVPFNVVEQITRTFSLIVRLFGNVMSGVFIVGILMSLAGLLVPIPVMALDLLTGAVQAYIFAVLSTVFIGAAIGDGRVRSASEQRGTP